MDIILIYNSRTGFTEKYSNWIGEELKCDMIPYKSIKTKDLEKYELVIFGSRVHAGRIEKLNKILKLFQNNRIKKLIVFTTGATPIKVEKAINKIWTNNFLEDELKNIPHYYFQSGLNYERMKFVDKMMMKILSHVLSRKKSKDQIETDTELAIHKSHDISSKEYIKPLIEYGKNNF